MAMFNPFLPSFSDSPYRQYAALRKADPVHYSGAFQAWVLTRYDDCERVLRDPATFASNPNRGTSQLSQALAQQRRHFPLGTAPTVLNSDPPVHGRLRGIVNRAFTPRVIEGLRPRLEAIADDLLAEADGGAFDVVSGLAQPLPVIVIAELLGVPAADRGLFRGWSNAIAATTSVVNSQPVLDGARAAAQGLIDYLEPLIAERRRSPREDIISLLVQAEEGGGRLSHDELLAFCILLLVAGHETTTNLIGNGVIALAAAPDQAALMRTSDDALAAGIEELLRFDSPVQAVARVAAAPAEIGGKAIPAGDTIAVLVGAANRDPDRFPDPGRLDIMRPDNRHLSFGLGPHFCLGAPLARLEGVVAFGALLRRFPVLELDDGPAPRVTTLALRGASRAALRRSH